VEMSFHGHGESRCEIKRSFYSVIIQIIACRLQIQNCKENYRVIGRHSYGDIS